MTEKRDPKGLVLWLLILGCIVTSIGLIAGGWRQYQIGKGASSAPTHTELTDLERSPVIRNNYIHLGRHVRLYCETVFEYESKLLSSAPTADTRILLAFYPAISDKHPQAAMWKSLFAKYRTIDKIPQAEQPKGSSFSLLVKTFRFNRVGDIPAGIQDSQEMTGLIVNSAESLNSEHKKLIRESFPSIDFSRLLILEEGATPMKPESAVALMVGGGLVGLLGLVLFMFASQKRGTPSPRQNRQTPIDTIPCPYCKKSIPSRRLVVGNNVCQFCRKTFEVE